MKYFTDNDPMFNGQSFVFENTHLHHGQVRDIFESMDPDQKNVLYFLVGKAIEKDNDAVRPSILFRHIKVKKVIFNDPATIVFFEDGDKIVVKKMKGEEFDPEKGLAMAISKKALGDDYKKIFKKNCKEYYDYNPLSAFTTLERAFAKIARALERDICEVWNGGPTNGNEDNFDQGTYGTGLDGSEEESSCDGREESGERT